MVKLDILTTPQVNGTATEGTAETRFSSPESQGHIAVKESKVNHKEVADKVETVSMGLGITSGVVAAGAALAAPTGLSALGVAIGITSAPLIVTFAPVIGAIATATGVLSGGAYFYSKWKTVKAEKCSDNS